MSLGQMDPALVCSGPMSNLSYDSHIVTRCIVAGIYWKVLCNLSTKLFFFDRRRMVDELPRLQQDTAPDSYTAQQMDLEIQRVARELYKAFSGQNTEFKEVRRKWM